MGAVGLNGPWVSFCIDLLGPEAYHYFQNCNIMAMTLQGKISFEVLRIKIATLTINLGKCRPWSDRSSWARVLIL